MGIVKDEAFSASSTDEENRLRAEVETLKANSIADIATMNDRKSKIESLEAERDRLKEEIENPKMTYCAFCGEAYDIQDREKALELITAHVSVCPKHPIANFSARYVALVDVAKNIVSYVDNDSFDTGGWGDAVDKLKAALAEVKP